MDKNNGKNSIMAKQEIESITMDVCINYAFDVVIRRTFEGFQREMSIIKGILEKQTGLKFHPSTSELERLGVDYYAIVNGHLIGIQIKPLTYGQSRLVETFKKFIVEETHRRFQNLYGGRVYLVIALGRKEKVDRDKILKSIKQECERLKELPPGRFT
ncbi:MAG: MjaI family restriction endonuclease [Candidatus Bathyarchaeia archaeon]